MGAVALAHPLGWESEAIYAMADWLRSHGVLVDLHAHDLPPDIAGRYEEDDRSIRVNCGNARQALMTLAHEAGHWVGYRVGPLPHSYQRERQAFGYGWRVLQLFSSPVSRQEWIAFDRLRPEV